MADRRFEWGKAYLLSDLKEGVFENEPAVYVGKHNSDMERPTMCAVCGEPLGAKSYSSFCMRDLSGRYLDVMIGGGCIRDRIEEKKLDIEIQKNPWATLNSIAIDFPQSGRWYGTFLHHGIAKPYVRNKSIADDWNDSILNLPGVRFIMAVIDSLRDNEYALDAEKHIECGNIDLLATHKEKGTIIFDWKSDLCFENTAAYIEQINRYMSELSAIGYRKISGYILWIRDERKERVPFRNLPRPDENLGSHVTAPPSHIGCTLDIDMAGGEGIEKKRFHGYSNTRPYGEEAFFFIPPFEPRRNGYEFVNLEASPYREGYDPQWFDLSDIEDGVKLSFICDKKRHSFYLRAEWRRIRPFECSLSIRFKDKPYTSIFVKGSSAEEEDGTDCAVFEVSEIVRQLPEGKRAVRAMLLDEWDRETGTIWETDELQNGNTIKIPCIGDDTRFVMVLETVSVKNDNDSLFVV